MKRLMLGLVSSAFLLVSIFPVSIRVDLSQSSTGERKHHDPISSTNSNWKGYFSRRLPCVNFELAKVEVIESVVISNARPTSNSWLIKLNRRWLERSAHHNLNRAASKHETLIFNAIEADRKNETAQLKKESKKKKSNKSKKSKKSKKSN